MKTLNQYEYAYQNSEAEHHHSYLTQSLEPFISQGIATAIQHSQKPRILDLGCGNGNISNWLFQQGCEVVGVEQSPSGVAQARQHFPNCRFIQGSVYDLPYSELGDRFDIVLSAEVIEHLFYPKELVRSAKNCLKPGGRLILTTPYHGYFKNLALSITGKFDQHYTALWDGGHIKFFSVATLSTLLESEGYTNLQFRFAGRFPYLWKSMLCSSILR